MRRAARFLFRPEGRIGRLAFLGGILAAYGTAALAALLALGAMGMLGLPVEAAHRPVLWGREIPLTVTWTAFWTMAAVAVPTYYWTSFCVAAKRLHDAGQTAWWFVVTFLGFGTLLSLALLLIPGTRGTPNPYGPDPLPGTAPSDT